MKRKMICLALFLLLISSIAFAETTHPKSGEQGEGKTAANVTKGFVPGNYCGPLHGKEVFYLFEDGERIEDSSVIKKKVFSWNNKPDFVMYDVCEKGECVGGGRFSVIDDFAVMSYFIYKTDESQPKSWSDFKQSIQGDVAAPPHVISKKATKAYNDYLKQLTDNALFKKELILPKRTSSSDDRYFNLEIKDASAKLVPEFLRTENPYKSDGLKRSPTPK